MIHPTPIDPPRAIFITSPPVVEPIRRRDGIVSKLPQNSWAGLGFNLPEGGDEPTLKVGSGCEVRDFQRQNSDFGNITALSTL